MTVLKVVMVVLGIAKIVMGGFSLLAPEQFLDVAGLGTLSDTARLFMGALGVAWISFGAWAIYSVRELGRNIIFVKFAVTIELLNVAGMVYFAAAGYTTFAGVLPLFIMASVFSALLLIFYPWRAGRREATKA